MQANKVFGYIFIAAFLILCVVGFFIFPDTLVMQINLSGGAGTTLPKTVGLLAVLALGAFVSVRLIIETNGSYYFRWYLAAGIILIVNILIFVFNM